jgi:hypothetical protein
MAAAMRIEIRLASAAQLFHTLDPAPFREGDLAAEAEDYILGWAGDLPVGAALAIAVHLPETEARLPLALGIPDNLRGYFARKADKAGRDLRTHFRDGRRALVIGLAILAACLGAAILVAPGEGATGVARVAQESLVIVGWVALWRPAEIFLYDWLPIARRRALFARLAAAEVSVVPA